MTSPQSNLHDIKIDPRNLNILISVNGALVPRAEAVVSVFDSGFILGDGVWEACRFCMRTLNGFTKVPNPFSWISA
jgi:hypothetical protein